MSANEDDLRRAVLSVLEDRGVLDKLRAVTRQEVMRALREEGIEEDKTCKKSTDGSGDNFLAEEVILEYLEWNGMKAAAEALKLESNRSLKATSLSRDKLEASLSLKCGQKASQVPLLYVLINEIKKKRQD